MMWTWLFVLLPIASLTGWYFGRKGRHVEIPSLTNQLHSDYFLGLNYLINEQPDKAVDIFIRLVEVDSDTVETHLALGSLFRRRGEVDRAIRIHQNIMARPGLDTQQRIEAQHSLGLDYLKAGVLDRAEAVFQELISVGATPDVNLAHLLNIYQQQKDWEKAVNTAQKLEAMTGKSQSENIAQYYCELAELAFQKNNLENAQKNLKYALNTNKNCARASILLGKYAMLEKDYASAIKYLQNVKSQDPDFLSEIIPLLIECHVATDNEAELVIYLRRCLKEFPRISVVLALTERIQRTEGTKNAIEFIAEQIRTNSSLRGLERLIDLYLTHAVGDTHEKLMLLYDLVKKLLSKKPVYLCKSCGFTGNTLYWSCPGCRHWNSVRPIHGLEGD